MPAKKLKVVGSVSQQLRTAEAKRDVDILERIRQDVMGLLGVGECSPRVSIRVRSSRRLSSRS